MAADQACARARHRPRIRTLLVGGAALILTAALLPATAMGQLGRRGFPQGSAPSGYGYPAPGYPAPAPSGYAAPGGYPPAAYGAPAPAYPPSGYGAPGYAAPPAYGASGYPPPGYPPQGYAPSAYQQPYAYPPQGQNPQQVAASQQQCQSWASAQSGYSPNAPTTGPTQTTGQSAMAGGRSVLRGAGRGAAAGAAGAAAGAAVQGDDAGDAAASGAAAGAAVGGLMGGFKRRDQRSAQTQQQNQAYQQQSQQSAAYSRALEACLTGQGYTVRDGGGHMSQWSRWAGRGLLIGLGAIAPGVAGTAELDGSAPILCAVMGITECDRWGMCEAVDGSSMGVPPFLRVNVGGKTLEAIDGSGRKAAIHSSMVVKERARLLVHGGEAGRAWSAVIDQRTGEMTAAVTDHDGGFLIAGACTLP